MCYKKNIEALFQSFIGFPPHYLEPKVLIISKNDS